MTSLIRTLASLQRTILFAGRALRKWRRPQFFVAIIATAVVGLLMGLGTVLIPNSVFARDLPPEPWNYPAWIAASVLSGLLFATYVRPLAPEAAEKVGGGTDDIPIVKRDTDEARRSSRMGVAGAFFAWFAVGCPVCNKLAVIALGYTGAITWFAPIQPYLALIAIILSGVALLWRLRGQIACPSTKIREVIHA
jgi:hypothetical protein